jgi:hypothetical protein
MEADAALVWPDGAVHLNPEPRFDVDFALIVHPRDPEDDDPLRLDHALNDPRRRYSGLRSGPAQWIP